MQNWGIATGDENENPAPPAFSDPNAEEDGSSPSDALPQDEGDTRRSSFRLAAPDFDGCPAA
jgi:hypothetical protein